MALVWMDGFDKYGTTDGGAVNPAGILRTRYNQRQERVDTYAGRYGDYSIVSYWNNASWIQTPSLTTDDTLIVGFSMYCPDPHNDGEIFQLRSPKNYHSMVVGGVSLNLNSDRSLTLYRGITSLGSTASGVVPLGGWCTIELKIVCDNSAGEYELHVDGTDELSATGVDTQYSTDSYHSVVRFNGGLASTTPDYGVRIDDFWVCSGSGGEWSDFLGPAARITTLSPNADGDWTLWTEQPSGNHYEVLDEAIQDDTNYVESSTVDEIDLYEYESVATLNTLLGVQVVTETITTEPNAWSIKTVILHDTTEDADAGQTVGTDDWTAISRIMEKNPVTSNLWTTTDVNNLQAGIKVV